VYWRFLLLWRSGFTITHMDIRDTMIMGTAVMHLAVNMVIAGPITQLETWRLALELARLLAS